MDKNDVTKKKIRLSKKLHFLPRYATFTVSTCHLMWWLAEPCDVVPIILHLTWRLSPSSFALFKDNKTIFRNNCLNEPFWLSNDNNFSGEHLMKALRHSNRKSKNKSSSSIGRYNKLWMRDKTADFREGQNSRLWKREKIADFDNDTKPPILKWGKITDS